MIDLTPYENIAIARPRRNFEEFNDDDKDFKYCPRVSNEVWTKTDLLLVQTEYDNKYYIYKNRYGDKGWKTTLTEEQAAKILLTTKLI